MTPSVRQYRLLVPALALAVAAACSEAPTAGVPLAGPNFAKPAPPPTCSSFAPLSITLADAAGDGLRSDGGGAYVENPPATEAHINGPTGNLSIWTTGSPRSLTAVTALGNIPIDRVYTNNHNSPCGLDLDLLPVGSNTTAVLEAEERSGGTGSTVSIARYGKDCSDGSGQVVGPKVAVTRPSASTIVLTGTAGKYCTKGKGNRWVDRGAVGPFVMTLAVVP